MGINGGYFPAIYRVCFVHLPFTPSGMVTISVSGIQVFVILGLEIDSNDFIR